MDDIDLLLEMYKLQVSRSEHFERLRSSISSLVLTLAVALIGIATYDLQIDASDTLVGAAIVLLGIFGSIASSLHSRRAQRHGTTAGEFREAIDRLMPTAKVDEIHSRVRADYDRTHINLLWAKLHWAIIGAGAVITVMAIVRAIFSTW
jgi:hypothetical protein